MTYEIKKVRMPDGRMATPARERVRYAKETGVTFEINTEFLPNPTDRLAFCRATLTILTPGYNLTYTGHAAEAITFAKGYNKAYENAETKAIGRAFAAAGFGIDDDYASAEELQDVTTELETKTPTEQIEKGLEAVKNIVNKIEPSTRRRKVDAPKQESEIKAPPVEEVPVTEKEEEIAAIEETTVGDASEHENPVTEAEQIQEAETPTVEAAEIPFEEHPEEWVGSNSYNVDVKEPDAKKGERPFAQFLLIYNAMKGTQDHSQIAPTIEATYKAVSAGFKREEVIAYPDYEHLCKKAPVRVVNIFLNTVASLQKKANIE